MCCSISTNEPNWFLNGIQFIQCFWINFQTTKTPSKHSLRASQQTAKSEFMMIKKTRSEKLATIQNVGSKKPVIYLLLLCVLWQITKAEIYWMCSRRSFFFFLFCVVALNVLLHFNGHAAHTNPWGWKWSNLIWPNVAIRLLHCINSKHLRVFLQYFFSGGCVTRCLGRYFLLK